MEHYNFFCNKECEYFPCHKTDDLEHFNCLFCYCPLYSMKDCGGRYTIMLGGNGSLITNGLDVIKDCSNCLIPHKSYDYVVEKLKRKGEKNVQI